MCNYEIVWTLFFEWSPDVTVSRCLKDEKTDMQVCYLDGEKSEKEV